MITGLFATGLASYLLLGAPIIPPGVVIDGTEITAKTSEGVTTAEVKLINGGDAVATLSGMTTNPSCTVTPASVDLQPRQATAVKLTLEAGCPADKALVVDFDGPDGPLPAVTVKPPKQSKQGVFTQLLPGLIVGGALLLVTLLIVAKRYRDTVSTLEADDKDSAREYARTQFTARIRKAFEGGSIQVDESKLPKAWTRPRHAVTAPLTGLESSWKFSDSWLGNANIAAAGVVTLLSTTGLLSVLFEEVPADLTAAIAMGSAVALLLVAFANAVLRAVGKQSKVPTVGGFALAAGLSVLATTLNIVTVASEALDVKADLGMGAWKGPIIWGAAAAGLFLMIKYVFVSAREILQDGLAASAGSVAGPEQAAWVVAGAVRGQGPDELTPLEESTYLTKYGLYPPPAPPVPDSGGEPGAQGVPPPVAAEGPDVPVEEPTLYPLPMYDSVLQYSGAPAGGRSVML